MKLFRIKRRQQIFLIAFAAMVISLCACSKELPSYIAASKTVEAGSTFSAEDFILEGEHAVRFAEDFAAQFVVDGDAQINQVGKHAVTLIVDEESYSVSVTVKDTVAPTASARRLTVRQGDPLLAEDCVTDIEDRTKVTCAFKAEPNLEEVGVANEVVVLTDEGGNRTEIPVAITVIGADRFLVESYTIEAGDSIPAIDPFVAFPRTGKYVTDISAINTSLVGGHTLEVEIEGGIYTTDLIIKDTVAPTATVTPVEVCYGAKFPAADSFVSEIVDEGPVTVSYEVDPGTTAMDQTAVSIVLTDQGGNSTVYTAECSVIPDDEPPVFLSFPQEIVAETGTGIVWKTLVKAEDNTGTVELSLDLSGVNAKKAGTYTAFFVAKDPYGNKTKQEIKIILRDKVITKEMMDQVCEKIVSQIITEDMTTKEKLYAVYKYVVTNIRYSNYSAHEDVRREAYLSLTTRKSGDCFAFCAAAHELISYLGYETQIVRRDVNLAKEHGNHFWVLVNCGTKEAPLWYHHDASPHNKPYNFETYMMTDAQLKAYTNYRASTSPKKHYYTFDTSLYPASATEIVVDLGIDPRYFE